MPVFIFELSMPSNNAWNGKWTGDQDYYAKTRTIPASTVSELKPSYSYNFGDGWVARVGVRQVDGKAAAKARKRSKGFCGYEWMIDSILEHGSIVTTKAAATKGEG